MLDTKQYVLSLMTGNAALVTALGSADKIQYSYPNNFNALPIVTYIESGNSAKEWYDDSPVADDITITIDVWANVSTTSIAKLIDSIFRANLFSRDFSADVPEPDAKIFHKTLRYRRTVTADDLDLV